MDEIKPATYIGRHFSLIFPSFEAKKMFEQYIISVFEVYLVLFSLFKMRFGQNICFWGSKYGVSETLEFVLFKTCFQFVS